jgi:hypothetical protein
MADRMTPEIARRRVLRAAQMIVRLAETGDSETVEMWMRRLHLELDRLKRLEANPDGAEFRYKVRLPRRTS